MIWHAMQVLGILTGNIRWQLILPEDLRNEVLQQLQNVKVAGDLELAKTLWRVNERFYWPFLRRSQKKLHASMRTYNIGAPMKRVALDIVGILPVSEHRNKYVFVIGDYFSKRMEDYAIFQIKKQ